MWTEARKVVAIVAAFQTHSGLGWQAAPQGIATICSQTLQPYVAFKISPLVHDLFQHAAELVNDSEEPTGYEHKHPTPRHSRFLNGSS